MNLFNSLVQASETLTEDQVVTIVQQNPDSFIFNDEENTVIFSEAKAEKAGMNSQDAKNVSNYFNSLTDKQKAIILQKIGNQGGNTRVAPLLIWAAGVIGGWLGTKLLDWGASKFCKAYRHKNKATKYVCDVID